MKSWDDHLDLLIRARTPLLWIRSSEEERVEVLLEQAAKRLQSRRLASWDFIGGLKGVLNEEGLGAQQPMAVLQWLQKLEASEPTLLLVKDLSLLRRRRHRTHVAQPIDPAAPSTPHRGSLLRTMDSTKRS